MIPFLPSQNTNVMAALAQLGGMSPQAGGASASGKFAPVFGNAIVGQLVAGLPNSAFSGGEEGIDPAAWAQLAEAVRVLTQNGAVSPATLEQMRGVMLVNIELLRRGAGEAQALQAGTFPAVSPVAPVGVQGVPVSDALIPAPAVPGTVQSAASAGVTGETSSLRGGLMRGEISPALINNAGGPEDIRDMPGRRRDAVGGAEAMMMAGVAGLPAGRPEMNVEQAFAALERIVAQAPASELVPLARALRQVINTPVAVPVMPGIPGMPALSNGVRTVAVSASPTNESSVGGSAVPAGGSVPASERGDALATPRGGETSTVAAGPVMNTTPALVANPAQAVAVVPQGGETSTVFAGPVMNTTPAPVADPAKTAAPVPQGIGTSPVSSMTVEAVAVATSMPVQPVAATATDETAPINFQPVEAGVFTPVVESSRSVAAPFAASSDEPVSSGPMFIPENDSRPVNTPAFATNRPDAGVELDAVAVPSGEVAPMIVETADEPVAWLARQAQTGEPAVAANVPSVPAVGINEEAGNVPPAIIPSVAVAPQQVQAVPAPRGGEVSSALHADGSMPAVALSTLPIESLPANSARQVVPAPVADNGIPAAVIPAAADRAVPVSTQTLRQPVQVNEATQAAVNVAAGPVQATNQNQAAVIPVGAVSAPVTTSAVQVTAESSPVSTATSEAASQAGDKAPESLPAPVSTASNSGQAVEAGTNPREAGKSAKPVNQQDGDKAANTPVTGRETPAQAAERAEAPQRARTARIGAVETANTAADAAINAARGQAREAVSLPVAVQAVMARVAEAVTTAKPGEIRQLDLRLATPDLGMIRVKFEVGEEGLVRVVIKTSTEMAATAIRDGLPQFRNTVENRNVSVQVTQVSVGTAADFGGGNNPHTRPEWSTPFTPPASSVNRDEPEFVARAPEGALRRRTLVDILA